MPDVSSVQSSWLGGEWSPYSQGRFDHPKYRTSMNVCRNGVPLENGSWNRRSGTNFLATTRNGAGGRLVDFDFEEPTPYRMEFTNGHLRLFVGTSLVFTDDAQTVVAISTDTPAQVLITPSTFITGDQVQFLFNGVAAANSAILRNRQFVLTELGGDGTTYTLADPITGVAVTGVNWSASPGSIQMARVLDIATPWTSPSWISDTLRSVQPGVDPDGLPTGQTLLLRGDTAPQVLLATANLAAPEFASFALDAAIFQDGPYLDPVPGLYATANALAGTPTITIAYPVYAGGTTYFIGNIVTSGLITYQSLQDANIGNLPGSSPTFWKVITDVPGVNGGAGFLSTDVGRHMRLFSEPPVWASGTAYTAGQSVQYPFGSGQYWTALAGTTGTTPGSNFNIWGVGSNVALWAWGRITQVTSSLTVVLQLVGFDPAVVTQGAGNTLLYNSTIYTWQLGVFNNTTWPSSGGYHGGRLYLGGAVNNRFDASVVNGINGQFINMAPTAADGTVSDANGISYTLNAQDSNSINSFQSVSSGVIANTLRGEWLIQASALNDPITPTSIQVQRVTRYGSAPIEPLNTPVATIFVQKQGQTIMELMPDVFTGKYRAPNLTLFAGHLFNAGIAEIRYQEALTPLIWARMKDGTLAGCTYRRISSFVSGESDQAQEAALVGWHRHDLGSGRVVQSIMVGENVDATLDALAMVTNQTSPTAPDFNIRHVELLVDLFQETQTLQQAWYVDDGVVPQAIAIGAFGVTMYGLWHLNGKIVSAWIGGLDCGDYLVADGNIFVPFQSDPGQFFTAAFFESLNGQTYRGVSAAVSSVTVSPPSEVTTPATMQWFVDPTPGHAAIGNTVCLVAWDLNYVLLFNTGGGLTKFQLSTGALIGYCTGATLFSNGHNLSTGNGSGCIAQDGFVYFSTDNNTIAKINPTTLTLVSESGAASGSGAIISMAPIVGPDGLQYIVLGIGAGLGTAIIFSCSSMALVTGTYTNNAGEGTVVYTGTGAIRSSVAFGVCNDPLASLPIMRATLAAGGTPTYSRFASIAASSVGSANNVIETLSVPVIDTTDGNLLLFVSVGYGTVGTPFLIKINAVNGNLMWTAQVPNGNLATDQPGTWNNSRIAGGVCVFQAGADICIVNTLTGAITTQALGSGNGQIGGGQASDSITGVNFCFSNFSSGTSTFGVVGVNGTPSGFSFDWGMLKVGTLFQGSTTTATFYSLPAIVGFTFTSQGQRLRPQIPQDAGVANGPALAKNMRTQMYGALLANSIGLSIGPDFAHLLPVKYWNPDETPYTTQQMWTGVMWVDGVDGVYDFDNMVAWEITRPYPTVVASVGQFLHGSDR